MIALKEGVQAKIDGTTVRIKGPLGEISKKFESVGLKIELKDGGLSVVSPSLMVTNTAKAHLANMVRGVTEGYVKKMQVVYAHFPISLEVKGGKVLVKNFLGEKKPREAVIPDGAKIEIKGQDVTVSGIDKEKVGQAAANLRTATKISKRDSRVFQDGIYPILED
ncbi:MAG: 50S ribosomal protein L6 [Candidatus Micrarchaeota archaeon]|nr:50S ribosomal protein L6 [Candidatus Micrarchaeota archaeon]